MQIQSAKQTSAKQASPIEARCPHGAMPGACPMCSGAGGGSGKRNSNLMGWNEAYAVWKSIQVAQTRQVDYLKGITDDRNRIQNEITNAQFRATLAALVARAVQNAGALMANMFQAISRPVRQMEQVIRQVVRHVAQTLQQTAGRVLNTLARVLDVAAKLATILGDTQKLLTDIWRHNIENIKSLIAKLRLAERLAQIESLAGNILRPFTSGQIFQTAQRKLKSVLGKLKGFLGLTDENELGSPEA